MSQSEPQKTNVPKKAKKVRQSQTPHDVSDDDLEESGHRFLLFNAMPSWMVSFLCHIAVIIILAIIVMPIHQDPTLAVEEMLSRASMSLSDIDLFIPHQANLRIIDAAVDSLGIEREKVFINLDRYGNTSSASIPISIAEAIREGRIRPGSNVLMVGFGAGLTWGACLFRW